MTERETEPVRIEVTLPAPFATVWRAFRDPAEIRRWHGWDYNGLEDEIRTIFDEGTEASEEDRTLQIGGHRFTLDAQGGETIVRVVRASPASGDGDWVNYYDEIEEGWLTFLQQLRFLLARRPAQDRRALFLTGAAIDSTVPPVDALLGIAGLADLDAGQRYGGTAAWGEPLSGEVWFRSPLQLGVTVDGWGDGLLVLFQAADRRTASAVVSTYGLDDGALAGLEDRLTAWWRGHFEAPAEDAAAEVPPG
jgi:hypothetical protein